ncbi:hypothetical protein BAMA_10505 [Bacillus manliponensis]|uniref:Uncharacterized protein n=2 Tax=Bacillus manliponensis TaxID=574376 RepID=A0A073JUE3_9BACI|nr:hypothetical protein BAMA_10505 [Bacillus manliponensis]
MFLIGISLNGGRYSQVKVNGDWKKYTEVVLKGEETFSKWEDMTYIGSGVLTDIKFAHLTIEEIKKIEETIHKI